MRRAFGLLFVACMIVAASGCTKLEKQATLCWLSWDNACQVLRLNLDLPHQPRQLIVRMRTGKGDEILERSCQRYLAERNVRVLSSLEKGRSIVVELPDFGPGADDDERLRALAAELQTLPGVESIEANVLLAVDQAGPIGPFMWGLEKIHIEEAWKETSGSSEITVAVLDDGVDYRNDLLKSNMWLNPCEDRPNDPNDVDGVDGHCAGSAPNGLVDDLLGWDFVDEDREPLPEDGDFHGTHVAGTIGALLKTSDNIGGVTQHVSLVALRVAQNGAVRTDLVVRAIEYAIDAKVDVINASWSVARDEIAHGVLPLPTEQKFPTIEAAVAAANQANILFVVAAGNAGADLESQSSYPASYRYDNVVAVAASDPNDGLWERSNRGIASVDLAAPGVEIRSAGLCPNGPPCEAGETIWGGGTSLAAPFVSGVAALVLAKFPGVSMAEVKRRLLAGDCIEAFRYTTWSGARLNAAQALSSTPPVVPCSERPNGWGN